jgi:HrpA-like RNA helicase
MLNLGSVEDVLGKTIEPPEPERVRLAIESLLMLGAMDQKQNLSPLGRVLAQIPIEAAIGKLCLFGAFFKCLDSALTLAAVLTSRDPFMAPEMMKKQADSVKNSWAPLSFRSDPLAIVAAYRHWDGLVERRDDRSAHMFIQDNFLNRTSLYSIKQLKTALLKSLEQTGIIAVSSGLAPTRFNRGNGFANQLNENGNSLPLLAALIAIASAPKFALQMGKQVQTAQDTVSEEQDDREPCTDDVGFAEDSNLYVVRQSPNSVASTSD